MLYVLGFEYVFVLCTHNTPMALLTWIEAANDRVSSVREHESILVLLDGIVE